MGGGSMARFVGLDVSQKLTSICVVDETGARLWRGQCATEPEQIGFFDASNGFEQVPQRRCDQVDDGRERGDVAVAARTRPGRLEETVEPFETGVAVG